MINGAFGVSANAGGGGVAVLLPGQIYVVTLNVGTCQTGTPNVNHYLTLAAGNAGFTYEVLSYGADTTSGTVVV